MVRVTGMDGRNTYKYIITLLVHYVLHADWSCRRNRPCNWRPRHSSLSVCCERHPSKSCILWTRSVRLESSSSLYSSTPVGLNFIFFIFSFCSRQHSICFLLHVHVFSSSAARMTCSKRSTSAAMTVFMILQVWTVSWSMINNAETEKVII